jgi:hypothetical protein
MTIYEIVYRDGKKHTLTYVDMGVPLEGDRRWKDVRRLARDASGNRSGAAKVIRKMTGETVWETSTDRKPGGKGKPKGVPPMTHFSA